MSTANLLVTNDFPPKIGGIQSYLYELWRRLPPGHTTVLSTAFAGAPAWDAQQDFRIERVRSSFLAPTPGVVKRVNALAEEIDAQLVLLDPAWPLGTIGPKLDRPYGLIVHGAEVSVPARLPFAQLPLRSALRDAAVVIAAGAFSAREAKLAAGREIPTVVIPPGVDASRFQPIPADERTAVRLRFGIPADATVVLGVSRLVARKGFDVLIQAAAHLHDGHPSLVLALAGEGRDRARLEKIAESVSAPVRFLGRVDDADLPGLYGSADLFAMLCRDRWFGLEQEGFGIVFLEAAAAGLPAVAGLSGGSADAVVDGVTGRVVSEPSSLPDVLAAVEHFLTDPSDRRRQGEEARRRALRDFSYDVLAERLGRELAATVARLAGDDGEATVASQHAGFAGSAA